MKGSKAEVVEQLAAHKALMQAGELPDLADAPTDQQVAVAAGCAYLATLAAAAPGDAYMNLHAGGTFEPDGTGTASCQATIVRDRRKRR